MKTVPFLSLVIALSGASLECSTFGQSPETPKQEVPAQEGLRNPETPPKPQREPQHWGPLERSSKLLGATLKDAKGDKIGKVRDLAVDLQRGRVLQVIVSSGGLLGVGGKHIALPPTTLSVDPSGEVTTQVSRQKFDDAPEFDSVKWQESTRPEQVMTMYRYYDLEPRWVPGHGKHESGRVSRTDATGQVGGDTVERATKLVGMTVIHDSGKDVGKVNDLVVDLSHARVPVVVVSVGGVLGVGDELNVIPSPLFRYQAELGKLALLAATESLQSAPRFKDSQWSEMTTSEKINEAYRVYGVKSTIGDVSAKDPTQKHERDREPGVLTPFDQGESESDIKTTSEIRKSVFQEDGLSVAAQNIKIITLHGRVTLRGSVKTVTEKERIEAVAKSIAGDDKVDSHLEVASENPDK